MKVHRRLREIAVVKLLCALQVILGAWAFAQATEALDVLRKGCEAPRTRG